MFAALALGFGWAMANRVQEKKGGPSSVVLLDAKKGGVQKIVYTWPNGSSTVVPAGGEGARSATVELSREIETKPKDAANKDAEHKDAEHKDGEHKDGEHEDGEPKDGEAPAPATTREDARFPGGQGRYARVKGERVVHLLDAAIVTGLEGGVDQLMEKRVVVAEPERLLGYEVTHGDKSAAFVHENRAQAAARFFAKKGGAHTKDDDATKLMTTLRGLRATKLASPAQAGSAFATFTLEIEGRGRPQVLQLFERTDGEGYLVKVDDWLLELSQTQGKELVEDLDAAL
jgi:hypothetical protein